VLLLLTDTINDLFDPEYVSVEYDDEAFYDAMKQH
jgi:hypothetical protein